MSYYPFTGVVVDVRWPRVLTHQVGSSQLDVWDCGGATCTTVGTIALSQGTKEIAYSRSSNAVGVMFVDNTVWAGTLTYDNAAQTWNLTLNSTPVASTSATYMLAVGDYVTYWEQQAGQEVAYVIDVSGTVVKQFTYSGNPCVIISTTYDYSGIGNPSIARKLFHNNLTQPRVNHFDAAWNFVNLYNWHGWGCYRGFFSRTATTGTGMEGFLAFNERVASLPMTTVRYEVHGDSSYSIPRWWSGYFPYTVGYDATNNRVPLINTSHQLLVDDNGSLVSVDPSLGTWEYYVTWAVPYGSASLIVLTMVSGTTAQSRIYEYAGGPALQITSLSLA